MFEIEESNFKYIKQCFLPSTSFPVTKQSSENPRGKRGKKKKKKKGNPGMSSG